MRDISDLVEIKNNMIEYRQGKIDKLEFFRNMTKLIGKARSIENHSKFSGGF